jgi:hypothetical protein
MSILAQTGVFSYALQYAKYGTGTLAAAKAIAKIIASGNPANNNTVTVGTVTYTFKTTLTPAANEVKIGTTALASISNLAAAINAGAGSGTAYGAGTTANADFVAVAAYQTVFLTAVTAGKAGNALALSKSGTNLSIVAPSGGLDAGAFDISTLSYAKARATDIDYEAVQDSRIFPLEVGGVITPTGAYKAGAFVGGGATLFPRLEDRFGDLLLALMGSASVAVNTPVAGAYTHTFKFDPNALEEVPWLTVRKHVPGRGNTRPQGLVGIDNKLAQMRLMVPQNDVLSARVDFAGRVPQFDNYSDAWLYANNYENADKAAYSCIGSFQIPTIFANQLPVTGVIIEMVNNITTPQEEKVVGAYFPDDYVVRTRSMQIRFVLKWADPELYQRAYTNQLAGTAWAPQPFITNYDGGTGKYAFQADISSTAYVTGTTPYKLTIRAGTVVWEAAGPVRLMGGGIISLEFRGTVLEPDAALGVPYAELLLVNGRSSAYTVPSQP